MSFTCERCGHRKWGYPLGGLMDRRVCHDCYFGGWTESPSESQVWSRLAHVAHSAEFADDETCRLLDSADGQWTIRLTPDRLWTA